MAAVAKTYLKNVQNKGLQLNRLVCVCNDFSTVHGRDADIYRDMYIFRNDKFTFAADNDSQRAKEKNQSQILISVFKANFTVLFISKKWERIKQKIV